MFRQFTLLPVLCLALFVAGQRAAQAICVANDVQLGSALVQGEFAPVTIELVQGVYHLDDTVWHGAHKNVAIQNGSSLLGGYTPACASRNIEVDNTVLRDDTPTGGDGPSIFNNLLIEGITFYAPATFDAIVSGSFSPKVTIRRSAFLHGGSLNFSQLDDIEDPGGTLTARVENTLIAGNNYGSSGCALGAVAISGLLVVEVINSTIVDNSGTCGVGGSELGGGARAILELFNNIIWNNAGADVLNDSSATQLFDNIVGTHSYPTPEIPPVGTINADPKLQANYHLIEPGSPAINAGTSDVPNGLPLHDLDGGARVNGDAVDLGAFESGINNHYVQVVRNTDNGGTDSLREAVNNVIANGGGLISFAIDGDCPHVITLQSAFADLTGTVGSVFVNGYSQPGSSRNDLDFGFDATICIVVKANDTSVQHAFRVPSGAQDATSLDVSGIDFGGFGFAPISLRGGSNHVISGNRLGVLSGGSEDPDRYDVYIGPGVSGVTVGGDDASARNLIETSTDAGVFIDTSFGMTAAAHGNQVVNNYIGMGWSVDHFVVHANSAIGIYVGGFNNTIADNYIGYNGGDGVQLDQDTAHGNTITGNTMGGQSNSDGNGGSGVMIQAGAHDNDIIANTIDYNSQRGVRVVSGLHNRISANFIAGNGNLGIDIAGVGVTPNDDDATPLGSSNGNRGQNFPDLLTAIGGHYVGRAAGTLTTTPGKYKIELFGTFTCDAGGHGEGAPYLGSRTVTVPVPVSGDQGTVNWSTTIRSAGNPFVMPPLITATATSNSGDTSEFSLCVPYIDDTIFADGFDPAFIIF